jgi:uncharacterized membrane protein
MATARTSTPASGAITPGVQTSPADPAVRGARPPRLDSVDLLRGVVMIIMALDHVRDYFSNAPFAPTDLTQTSTALFLTRWITHFCAPVFVLLAGTAAFLSLGRGRSRADLSRFLATRGLWLVFLELTLMKFAWESFNVGFAGFYVLQVIWVLGVSMIALAALIHLPMRILVLVSAVMVVGHNALDGIGAESFGAFAWLWQVLHVQVLPPGFAPLGAAGPRVLIIYPLIPWIGVMALGYALGALLGREELRLDPGKRRRTLIGLGATLTAAFVVLRLANLYGDPSPWSARETPLFTALSFLNTTKYPASLLFLLMTLGPALIALALFEGWQGRSAAVVKIFGRVPLFYFLLHLVLISTLAASRGITKGSGGAPGWWGGLMAIYLIWIAVVVLLYPVCAWFAGVKARRRDAWLSYL